MVVAALLSGCDLVFPFAVVPGEGGADGAVEGGTDGVVEGRLEASRLDFVPDPVPGTWVVIRARTFYMGSLPDEPCRNPAQETRHKVTLTRDFIISTTEVTESQFNKVMGYGSTACPNCPVAGVTWHQAAAYCNGLAKLAQRKACYVCTGSGAAVSCTEAPLYGGGGVYACPGYRLPTEAEWEYAYRAGTQTHYYTGDISGADCSAGPLADLIGWYAMNAGKAAHPVGRLTPNTWGLFDMGGNVWEWCHDWSATDLAAADATDPWGLVPGTSINRAIRGGSWYEDAGTMRAANRMGMQPHLGGGTDGLRCVRGR